MNNKSFTFDIIYLNDQPELGQIEKITRNLKELVRGCRATRKIRERNLINKYQMIRHGLNPIKVSLLELRQVSGGADIHKTDRSVD